MTKNPKGAGRKPVDRIYENGKEYYACPICGEKCTTYHYRTYKKCSKCHDGITKGISIDEMKAIRQKEIQNDYTDSKTINNAYTSENRIYDFIDRFPVGIYAMPKKGNGEQKEAQLLKDTYYQYSQGTDNIAEFNSLVNIILINSLEIYRMTNRLPLCQGPKKINERKILTESINKMAEQINKTVRILKDLKRDSKTNSMVRLTDEFKKMITYYHDNGMAYSAVGICEDCNKRFIMKSYFPTFKTRYLELIDNIYKQLLQSQTFDDKTIHEFYNRIKLSVNDDELAETYVSKHVREIESALL